MSDSTQHLCEIIMSHEFLLKWTDIWRFMILVAQHKMSHDTRRPYHPHYHNHDTFYVAQPCCTIVVGLNFCPGGRTFTVRKLLLYYKGNGSKLKTTSSRFQLTHSTFLCSFRNIFNHPFHGIPIDLSLKPEVGEAFAPLTSSAFAKIKNSLYETIIFSFARWRIKYT